jgi:hypothetical protein
MANWRSYPLADHTGTLYIVRADFIAGARETMDGNAVLFLYSGDQVKVRVPAKVIMADAAPPPDPPVFVAHTGTDPSQVTLSGMSDPNSTISVRDGAELVASVAADAAGTWESNAPLSLSPGSHTLVAFQTDVFGRQSEPSPPCVLSVPVPAPPPPPPEPPPPEQPPEPPVEPPAQPAGELPEPKAPSPDQPPAPEAPDAPKPQENV